MRNAILVSLAGAALCLGANLLSKQLLSGAPIPNASGYRVIKTVPVDGDTFWDYLAIDEEARRVYITHWTHVVVMDADTYQVVGDIPNTPRVHGVALAPDLGRGFTSNGGVDTVTIFDLKTLRPLGTVKTGKAPDTITYDTVSKRVFVMNGRSQNATVIDAADGSVAGEFAVGGKPETAVADGAGHLYFNVEDKSQIVEIDTKNLTELHRWPLADCKEPTGLSMDREHRRLFPVCQNKKMEVVDSDSGKVIATLAIGEGPDASAFDPEKQLAFSSNEAGTLTVVHEDSPNKFRVIDTVKTKNSARTMALDPKTHRILLPAANVEEIPGEMVPKVNPGTFVIVVVGQ
jgi:DNA-binding beta-propeller fold protein YncE